MNTQNPRQLDAWFWEMMQKPQNTWTDYEAKVVAAYQNGMLQEANQQPNQRANLPAVSRASHQS